MRNVSKFLVVLAAAALSVSGCVSQDQASDEPPGDTQTFSEPPAPECTAADITVDGAPGEKPTVTLPEDCSAPTELIVEDLAPGDGPEAAEGGSMQAHYALTAWSTGQEVEASFGQSPLPIETIGTGLIEAWNQGLVGMRQGGRRLIVAPPEMAYAGSGNELQDETLVFVIDAVEVTAP